MIKIGKKNSFSLNKPDSLEKLVYSRISNIIPTSPSKDQDGFYDANAEISDYTAADSILINKSLYKLDFEVNTHYEELKEIKLEELDDIDNKLKFSCNFTYNYFIKNYEQFFIENDVDGNSIIERRLPYIYEIVNAFINSNTNVKSFQNIGYFENPEKIISTSDREELKKIIINTQKGFFKRNDLSRYLNEYVAYKEQLPYYVQINFDCHKNKENSISNVINQFSLYDSFLSYVSNNYSGFTLFDNSSLEKVAIDNNFINALPQSKEFNDIGFFIKFNSIASENFLSLEDYFAEKKCNNEIVGYNLQKFVNEGKNALPIQEWYVQNTDELVKIIDSQVKYNKPYFYKLNMLTMVYGLEYKIISIAGKEIKIKYKPIIYIYRTPSTTFNNRVLDYPPLEPEIEIIPYIGVANKLKFNFNTSIGEKITKPISLTDEEINVLIPRLKQAQSRLDEKLIFKTDEKVEYFEIYKITKKPKNYDDFKNSKLDSVRALNSTAASYEDSNIIPNVKYYYMFRSLDYHLNPSNPSQVYEVEILNQNGLILPIIKLYNFESVDNVIEQTKSFKKFLYIKPAIAQDELVLNNKQGVPTVRNVDLGTSVSPLWNKNCKIRLISKSSGKKIDINFKFKKNISDNNE